MDKLTQLKNENRKLKEILKNLGYIFTEDNIYLTKEERLNIFMSYFKGRNDVYALKYFHKKENKFKYSPVCSNKFNKKYVYFPKMVLVKNVIILSLKNSHLKLY